jgi:hypothetical protein
VTAPTTSATVKPSPGRSGAPCAVQIARCRTCQVGPGPMRRPVSSCHGRRM